MVNNLVPEQRMDKNGHLVTRHVRQEVVSATDRSIPAPAPLKPVQGPQTDAQTLADIETLVTTLYAHSSIPADEHLSVDDLTPWMVELFSSKTLAIGAGLFRDPHGNHVMNNWFMRGMLEAAEDAYTEVAVVDRISEVLPRVKAKVEQAVVIASSNKFDQPNRALHSLLSTVRNQAETGVQQAIRSGAQSSLPRDDDSDILRANVSLLILNLVSPLDSRKVLETPAIYENLDRIYHDMGRILPYLPEFQRRGEFSFEMLDELEQAKSQTMIDGIL